MMRTGRSGGSGRRRSRPRCKRCASLYIDYRWQVFADGTKHIRTVCRGCAAFISYARQEGGALELAGPPPETGEGDRT